MARDRTDERYDIPNADVLFEDTWGEGDVERRCPRCGGVVADGASRCVACGATLAECSGSCPSCGLSECVGRTARTGD